MYLHHYAKITIAIYAIIKNVIILKLIIIVLILIQPLDKAVTRFRSMKGMRFALQVIITTLTLYYLNNTSTRAISQFLMTTFNIKVSHIIVYNWSNKFAPYLKLKVNKFKRKIDLQSEHTIETIVFINCIKHYLCLVIDSKIRFMVSFHLSRYIDEDSALALINQAKYNQTYIIFKKTRKSMILYAIFS